MCFLGAKSLQRESGVAGNTAWKCRIKNKVINLYKLYQFLLYQSLKQLLTEPQKTKPFALLQKESGVAGNTAWKCRIKNKVINLYKLYQLYFYQVLLYQSWKRLLSEPQKNQTVRSAPMGNLLSGPASGPAPATVATVPVLVSDRAACIPAPSCFVIDSSGRTSSSNDRGVCADPPTWFPPYLVHAARPSPPAPALS